MDNQEKKNREKMFEKGDFSFFFGKFWKMAEVMRNCCGKADMADCCSMMKKMMQSGEGEEPTKKKEHTGEAG